MKSIKLILFLILLICASCKNKNAQENPSKNNSSKVDVNNLKQRKALKFDEVQIIAFFEKYPELLSVKKDVDSFYVNRQYTYAWFDDKDLMQIASKLYNHIHNIENDGIAKKLSYTNEFVLLLKGATSEGLNADAELMLTSQYFMYAKKVWSGISEKKTQELKWYLPRKKLAYAVLLDSLLNGANILEKPPVYRQYTLLKKQLKKYQNIKKAGGFPVIATVKKSLKKGDSALVIIDIKKWLAISEDLPVNSNNNIYDENLEIAIKKFQTRFGLADDGAIGAGSIKQMNVPIETRIQQIVVNMERSRWLPVTRSTDYLVVNIPEFKLHAYEKDKLLWSMDAVVGKPLHKTVIFSGKIKYVVFSPYWNVPSGILRREILPNIRRNKNYLASQNMEWHKGQVRQKSGPNNSLGLVKFLFPNNFEIYLHDTPSKYLFNKNNRAFSHGCVRLSDAEKLANYLLKNDTNWTPKKIKTAMHLGKEKYVTLKKDETVFIVYFTSWVDANGQLNFRKDLYKRDKQLAAILLNDNSL